MNISKSVLFDSWVYATKHIQSMGSLCDPMDCSLPGSSVHGILQAIVLEWIAISFSRGSSQPRDQTRVFCIAGRFFTTEPSGKPRYKQHTWNFIEWGTLKVIWNFKTFSGIVQEKSENVWGALQNLLFTSWTVTPLAYIYIQHSGCVLWTCMLLSETGAKITWANSEGEWWFGSELSLLKKKERLLLP